MIKLVSFFLCLKNKITPNGKNIKKFGIIIHPKYFANSDSPSIISELSLLSVIEII